MIENSYSYLKHSPDKPMYIANMSNNYTRASGRFGWFIMSYCYRTDVIDVIRATTETIIKIKLLHDKNVTITDPITYYLSHESLKQPKFSIAGNGKLFKNNLHLHFALTYFRVSLK